MAKSSCHVDEPNSGMHYRDAIAIYQIENLACRTFARREEPGLENHPCQRPIAGIYEKRPDEAGTRAMLLTQCQDPWMLLRTTNEARPLFEACHFV
jgi:hypothetical protein